MCKSKEQNNDTLTHTEMLSLSLSLVGFDRACQDKVCTEKNSEQFKAFFGKLPPILLPLDILQEEEEEEKEEKEDQMEG